MTEPERRLLTDVLFSDLVKDIREGIIEKIGGLSSAMLDGIAVNVAERMYRLAEPIHGAPIPFDHVLFSQLGDPGRKADSMTRIRIFDTAENARHAVELGASKGEVARYIVNRVEDGRLFTSRERTIVDVATRVGKHWRDQDGVDSALLDELAEATKP